MIPTFLEYYAYQNLSPYKIFNLLAVAKMSEKSTPGFNGGMYTPSPFGVPLKSPSTHLKNEKKLTIEAWDNFDNTSKKYFSYLEEQSQK